MSYYSTKNYKCSGIIDISVDCLHSTAGTVNRNYCIRSIGLEQHTTIINVYVLQTERHTIVNVLDKKGEKTCTQIRLLRRLNSNSGNSDKISVSFINASVLRYHFHFVFEPKVALISFIIRLKCWH